MTCSQNFNLQQRKWFYKSDRVPKLPDDCQYYELKKNTLSTSETIQHLYLCQSKEVLLQLESREPYLQLKLDSIKQKLSNLPSSEVKMEL